VSSSTRGKSQASSRSPGDQGQGPVVGVGGEDGELLERVVLQVGAADLLPGRVIQHEAAQVGVEHRHPRRRERRHRQEEGVASRRVWDERGDHGALICAAANVTPAEQPLSICSPFKTLINLGFLHIIPSLREHPGIGQRVILKLRELALVRARLSLPLISAIAVIELVNHLGLDERQVFLLLKYESPGAFGGPQNP
jgi:hypothetical protein